jgi:tRNA nucleotidyltransferase (CCA-adding enzyme)
VAKAGSVYPQVAACAAALGAGRVIRARPGLPVRSALTHLDAGGAVALALGRGRMARRTELERAARWGLEGLPAGSLAWSGVPAVPGTAPEVRARRLLARGAPMVLITERGRARAVAEREQAPVAPIDGSLARRLEAIAGPHDEARLWLLRAAGKAGESLGMPVYLVGGSVRDLLLGRPSGDIDLAVEGDGLRFAARLADEVGGRLIRHPAFGTASIEDARGIGIPLGRIDIAATRRERYEAPGQLPRVSPAGIEDDLGRRDFTVNAMAVSLGPGSFGRLLDPHGGRADLARRRLRPLHPLSFVEDPTRIFRAARYGARLGLRLAGDAWRALAAALLSADLTGGFPALAGQRLAAELALVATEASAWRALDRLARWGALRLWDPRLGAARGALVARLRAAARLDAWSQRAGLGLDRGELGLLAVLLDQDPDTVERCLARLAVTGARRAALAEAVAGARATARDLAAPELRPSEAARRLRGRPAAAALGAWLSGGRRARHRVEWLLSGGQAVRASLGGGDLLALGVPEGPEVAAMLAGLRDARLDGRLRSGADERALVRAWLHGEKGDPR